MKPKSKNSSLLSFLVVAMSACMAASIVATTASAAPTTLNYATPAVLRGNSGSFDGDLLHDHGRLTELDGDNSHQTSYRTRRFCK